MQLLLPLDNDQPYNTIEVLTRLVWASEYLLREKSYDGHNYEEIGISVNRAKELIAGLNERAKKEAFDSLGTLTNAASSVAAAVIDSGIGEDNGLCQQEGAYWNYRVLAHENPAPGTGYALKIHEVHYNGCKPGSYSKESAVVLADLSDEEDAPLNEMKEIFARMRKALKKPVLYAGEKFPQVFEHNSLNQ